MSASLKDRVCAHCGTDSITAEHFVMERVYRNVDNEMQIIDKVHPCVFKYEEENQLGPARIEVLNGKPSNKARAGKATRKKKKKTGV